MTTLPAAVDERALERYLSQRLPDWDGPITIEPLGEGHSNLTFLLRCGPREVVLRRPPRGPLLPTAHDVLREHRILSALADTPVRAPKPILACEDASVIGAPFYLMERMEGVVIRQTLPPAFAESVEARAGLGEELVDCLATLHDIDWRAAGLEGFGRPEGYLERQLRRWDAQLEGARQRYPPGLHRPIPELDQVSRWLAGNLPESGPSTIVHGDYKLDNVMFAPQPPARLVAIFDWEMATLGDPLADLGWMLSFWREAGDPDNEMRGTSRLTEMEGFQRREELIQRYAAATGRRLTDFAFYHALAVWKLAIILEGSYTRFLAGTTADTLFAELKEGVPALARRALAITRGAS